MVTTNQQTIQFRDLFKELGMESLPIEKQAGIIEKVSRIVYKKILLRIMDKLSDEDAIEIDALLEKKDYEKVDEYIRDKTPDFITILKEEIEKVRTEVIGRMRV
ncbi:hypothetical protein KAW43_03075 [Candidatus Parcubacteria bacterium]|nr:hypothetical protein [Candidatus Parcubacteria bacterium]